VQLNQSPSCGKSTWRRYLKANNTHQLSDLSNKITELSDQLKLKYEDTASNSELNRLADDFADIKKTVLDIKYVEGAYAGLDDELAAIEEDREAFR